MITAALKLQSIEFPRINWKIVFSAGFLLVCASLVFYAFQINGLAKTNYQISGYQQKLDSLSEQNKNLQVFFAESSFLGKALAQAESMNFQKTTFVKYVQVPDNSIAKK